MGRLERQIMVGALALVGILVAVVILKGLAPRGGGESNPALTERSTPLMLEGTPPQDPSGEPESAAAAPWLDAPDFDLVPGAAAEQIPLEGEAWQPELALDPAPPVPASKDEYVIRDRDTLGAIAQRELGTVKRWRELLELNPGLDENHLREGTVIRLPARTAASAPPSAAAPPPSDAQFQIHTVVAGDALWNLAAQYLGDGSRYREIVAANSDLLKSEDAVLALGMKLRIPRK